MRNKWYWAFKNIFSALLCEYGTAHGPKEWIIFQPKAQPSLFRTIKQ